MRNNRGFTLIEVLASIVILSILATVFFQMFVFSQKTTTSSKEKLVAINVAQGVLERIKYKAHDEIQSPGTYTSANCTSSSNPSNCQKRYKIMVNNINYSIKIQVGGKVDSELNLYSAKVLVYDENGKIQSTVKGFVEL